MKNYAKGLFLAGGLSLLAGCMAVTPTKETIVSYKIYDVKVSDEIKAKDVTSAVANALREYSSEVRINNNIPPHPLPEKPGRFQLKNPFSNSNLGALAAAQGSSMKMPFCEEALMTANAIDDSFGKYGENTIFYTCVWTYTEGYHIDIYTSFSIASGGFNAATLGASLARNVVGDTSQFIPRTIEKIVSNLEETGAQVTLVEEYP
jgi:hypothetical protein